MKIFWLTQSDEDIPDTVNWLHPSELTIYSQFRFPKKKKDWILGRWTAKNTVFHYLKNSIPDLSLEQLAILPAEDGAPEVFYNGSPAPAFISLSHSYGTGFCVIASPGIKLGCDLEKVEARSVEFVQDYFTKKEINTITNSPKENHPLFANLIWSAKESALKALRTGLGIDTRLVEVDFSKPFEKGSWNKLKVSYLEDGSIFHGCWQYSSEFVFTMVSNQESFEFFDYFH